MPTLVTGIRATWLTPLVKVGKKDWSSATGRIRSSYRAPPRDQHAVSVGLSRGNDVSDAFGLSPHVHTIMPVHGVQLPERIRRVLGTTVAVTMPKMTLSLEHEG